MSAATPVQRGVADPRMVGPNGNGRGTGRRAAPPSRASTRRGTSPRRGLPFHAPSFSIGLVLGAAVVLITGYLPELLAPAPVSVANAKPGQERTTPPELRFEFDKILRTTPTPVTVQPAETTPTTAPLQPGSAPATAASAAATGAAGLSGEPGAATPSPTNQAGAAAAVPVVDSEAAADRPPAPASPATTPGNPPRHMLQAASFRSRADADRLRAELLLLDLPASTGEVNVGNSVWYRVTVGPFPDQATTDQARERLRERNLTAIPSRN